MVPVGRTTDAIRSNREIQSDWRTYDRVAEVYERVHAPRTLPVARDFAALAGIREGAHVLDVGAGTGASAQAAREAAGSNGLVVGIDPSLEMLAVARGRPGLRLAAAEAIDLPFRDGTFDTVTANFVLSHFAKLDTALYDLIRVLKPGGRVAASAWADQEDEFQKTWRELVEDVTTHELLQDALTRAMPNEGRLRDPHALEDTLRGAGLHPVTVERREYRFEMSLEDYIAGRETAASGRFVRDMLGEEEFRAFGQRVRAAFAERFPERLTDFRDVLLAVGTKPI
jgi:ubiquinone/menaquinone biosynthesis C-methylase UbiE